MPLIFHFPFCPLGFNFFLQFWVQVLFEAVSSSLSHRIDVFCAWWKLKGDLF